MWLSDGHRRRATVAILEACNHREWQVKNLNVQPDHVHIVLCAPEAMGKSVMRALKGWSSMKLNTAGQPRRHWWTRGGKVVPIFDEQRLCEAVTYVENQRFPKILP